MSPFPRSRGRAVEPDVAGHYSQEHGKQGWASTRNTALGAWPATMRRRAVWWTMAIALPLALLSLLVAFWAISRVSTVNSSLEEMRSNPSAEWHPFYAAHADIAANRIAGVYGMDVVAQVDTFGHALSVGIFPNDVVASPPDFGSITPRRDWIITPLGLERYVYLLRTGSQYETLSFFVSDGGFMTWPSLVPNTQISSPEASEPTVGAALPGYAGASAALGVADDEGHITACGEVAAPQEAVPVDLPSRIEEFVRAYTARDAETVRDIANSGQDWELYPRLGWRYRTGSMRLLCVALGDATGQTTGIAQVWWMAESVTDPNLVLPEVRDVRLADAQGLWLVFGAGLFMTGGTSPTN